MAEFDRLKPEMVKEVRITERTDGKTIAVVTVNPKYKGVALGKRQKRGRLRFLAKKMLPDVKC